MILAGIIVVLVLAALIMVLSALQKRKSTAGDATAATQEESAQSSTVTYNGKTYVYNDHLSNYLLMGVDKTEEYYSTQESVQGVAGQADALYLVSYDRQKESARVFAIPRDTMTQIHRYGPDNNDLGYGVDHLCLQYAYGDGKEQSAELTVEAVSKLFGQVPVQKYAAISMDGMADLADELGGIPLTVPDDSLAEVNSAFVKGAQVTLTGENVEQFVRYRDIKVSQSAIVRMNRQKVFLQAFLDRLMEKQAEDAGTITHLYEALRSHMVTDMSTDLFVDLAGAKMVPTTAPGSSEAATIVTIPGEGTEGELHDEYHVDDDALYQMIIECFYQEKE